MLPRLHHGEAALAELDARIEAAMVPWVHQLQLLQTIPVSRFASAAHLTA